MTDHEALEALSKKATQTEDDIRYYSGGSKYNEPLEQLKDRLVNLYRTGQLIPAPSGEITERQSETLHKALLASYDSVTPPMPSVDDAMVERVARSLAPFMEGGREYDQMPATRRELKIWSRNGMALINDATRDDAQEAAIAAISAMQVKP